MERQFTQRARKGDTRVGILTYRAISCWAEAFGERSRDWSLGHAGDEGPHLSMTGESRGFSSGGHRVRFLTRYDGEVSEPLVGRRGSRVSSPQCWQKQQIWIPSPFYNTHYYLIFNVRVKLNCMNILFSPGSSGGLHS